MVQTMDPEKTDQLVEPISGYLRHLFGDDVTRFETIDWNEKSRTFISDLQRDGYVLNNSDTS